MNTILTLLMYFAIGSIVIFAIGIAIQSIQSRRNSHPDRQSELKKGREYSKRAE